MKTKCHCGTTPWTLSEKWGWCPKCGMLWNTDNKLLHPYPTIPTDADPAMQPPKNCTVINHPSSPSQAFEEELNLLCLQNEMLCGKEFPMHAKHMARVLHFLTTHIQF